MTSTVGRGYRPDIDGLRAVAVLAVVLFHVGAPLYGGYVGVDVFFVISGFLITQIIARSIAQGRFSITEFYERRARRILPALFAVLLVVSAVCVLLLTPRALIDYGRSLAAAALSGSNVYFALRVDYFDDSSVLQPLLHTWSLGVEEQFYLFFPLFLLLGAKVVRERLWILILPVIGLSFLLDLLLVARSPSYAFYLPFTRLWELAIGALLAVGFVPIISSRFGREAMAAAGTLMVALAMLLFDEATIFPGWAALLPAVGSALIIHAGTCGPSAVGRVLSAKPSVFIGLQSYSLYLWHWPIIVLTGIVLGRSPLAWEAAALVGASFAAAVLSTRYVERPFRRPRLKSDRRRVFALSLAGAATASVVGIASIAAGGWPSRLPPQPLAYAQGASDVSPFRAPCLNSTPEQVRSGDLCVIGAEGVPASAAVVGDSFGDALLPAVDVAAKSAGISAYVMNRGGCKPLLGLHAEPYCEANAEAITDKISRSPEISTVLMIGRWSTIVEGERLGVGDAGGGTSFLEDDQTEQPSYEENQRVFERTLAATIRSYGEGKRVFVAAYIPEQSFSVPATLTARSRLGLELPTGVTREAFDERQSRVRDALVASSREADFRVIDVGAVACNDDFCPVEEGGRSLYVDDNHFDVTGAMRLTEVFRPAFTTG